MAEALGCTADELSRRITQHELSEWVARGLPAWPRRLEVLLAQVAYVLARVNGNRVELADFDLFAPRAEAGPLAAEDQALALSAIAGGVGVKVLGRKRREREAQAKSAASPGRKPGKETP